MFYAEVYNESRSSLIDSAKEVMKWGSDTGILSSLSLLCFITDLSDEFCDEI